MNMFFIYFITLFTISFYSTQVEAKYVPDTAPLPYLGKYSFPKSDSKSIFFLGFRTKLNKRSSLEYGLGFAQANLLMSDDYKINKDMDQYDLTIAYTYSLSLGFLRPFIGTSMVGFYRRYYNREEKYGQSSRTSPDTTRSLSLGPLGGLELYFNKHISVLAQYNYGFSITTDVSSSEYAPLERSAFSILKYALLITF